MILHPEVQRRAQAEIAAFLANEGDRFITPEDRPHLPYVDSALKEAFRMHPSVPLGGPGDFGCILS